MSNKRKDPIDARNAANSLRHSVMASELDAVLSWLTNEAKLERYFANFANAGYTNLSMCRNLDDETLTTLGITLPGHRKRLLIYSRKLAEALLIEAPIEEQGQPDSLPSSVAPPQLPPKKSKSAPAFDQLSKIEPKPPTRGASQRRRTPTPTPPPGGGGGNGGIDLPPPLPPKDDDFDENAPLPPLPPPKNESVAAAAAAAAPGPVEKPVPAPRLKTGSGSGVRPTPKPRTRRPPPPENSVAAVAVAAAPVVTTTPLPEAVPLSRAETGRVFSDILKHIGPPQGTPPPPSSSSESEKDLSPLPPALPPKSRDVSPAVFNVATAGAAAAGGRPPYALLGDSNSLSPSPSPTMKTTMMSHQPQYVFGDTYKQTPPSDYDVLEPNRTESADTEYDVIMGPHHHQPPSSSKRTELPPSQKEVLEDYSLVGQPLPPPRSEYDHLSNAMTTTTMTKVASPPTPAAGEYAVIGESPSSRKATLAAATTTTTVASPPTPAAGEYALIGESPSSRKATLAAAATTTTVASPPTPAAGEYALIGESPSSRKATLAAAAAATTSSTGPTDDYSLVGEMNVASTASSSHNTVSSNSSSSQAPFGQYAVIGGDDFNDNGDDSAYAVASDIVAPLQVSIHLRIAFIYLFIYLSKDVVRAKGCAKDHIWCSG